MRALLCVLWTAVLIATAAAFDLGDVVYLKSGSPAMTVVQVDKETLTTKWVNGNAMELSTFPAETLTLDDPLPGIEAARRAKAEALAPAVKATP